MTTTEAQRRESDAHRLELWSTELRQAVDLGDLEHVAELASAIQTIALRLART